MKYKRPSRAREALIEHSKQLAEKLGPMPDPQRQPAEFVRWMTRNAVPASAYYKRYPQARAVHNRLSRAKGGLDKDSGSKQKAEAIFRAAKPYLSTLRDARGPKWKAIAKKLREPPYEFANLDENQLRMIVRSRLRTTSSATADPI